MTVYNMCTMININDYTEMCRVEGGQFKEAKAEQKAQGSNHHSSEADSIEINSS